MRFFKGENPIEIGTLNSGNIQKSILRKVSGINTSEPGDHQSFLPKVMKRGIGRPKNDVENRFRQKSIPYPDLILIFSIHHTLFPFADF
ncbi:MAG: hypothetical protein EA341_00595 [Mongoliibacter sp.]|nr:MAG: hypothetical protein EA341_00595 [Mongoliibacter sp.]